MSRRRDESATGAAVADLFEQHGRMVYGLCRMMLGSREEAEDAAQQTFLSAHRTLLRGGSCREPAAWLATIARNECRRRLGRRRISAIPLQDAEPSGGAGPDTLAIEREELDALRRALTELPRAQRQAIVLREFYGLSYDEVAAALGRSGRAVESLLFKSRRTLNAQLQPLRDAAGALVLPATLRESLANLISGFSSSPGAAAAASTGGVAMTKVVGLPAAAKIAAMLAAGAAATGLATEGILKSSGTGRPAKPPQAHGQLPSVEPAPRSAGPTAPRDVPVVFSAAVASPSRSSSPSKHGAAQATHGREHEQQQSAGEDGHATSTGSATGRQEQGDGGERRGSSSGTAPATEGEHAQTAEAQPTGTKTTETRTQAADTPLTQAPTTQTQTTQTQTTDTQSTGSGDGGSGSGDSGGQDAASSPSADD